MRNFKIGKITYSKSQSIKTYDYIKNKPSSNYEEVSMIFN